MERNQCRDNGLAEGSGAGVHATGSYNRIVGNQLTGADRGLDIDGSGNYVADNTVKGNTDNYDIAAGNQLNLLLCEIPESIDWPANVILAGSLTGVSDQSGVTINANDVTIDLAGHALIGAPGEETFPGIFIGGRHNLEIRNGTIRDFGGNGIHTGTNTGRNIRIIGVRVLSNYRGISLSGQANQVTNCTAQGNTDDGIMVSDGCTVTGNTANENGRNGIIVGNGCTVTGNTARSNQFDGISVANGCTVTGNTATNNTGDGIQASGACRIFGNTCDDDGAGEGDGAGIHTTYSENHIEGNSVTGNDRGIDVDGIFGSVIGSIIIRNTASGNTTNYDIANGNTVGEILDFSAGPGGTITSGNPWANFEY